MIVQSLPTLITIFICTLNINTIFPPHRHLPGPHMSPHSCTARQLVSKGKFNPGVDVMLVDTMSPSNLSRYQEQSFYPVSAKLGKFRSGRSGWREVKMSL